MVLIPSHEISFMYTRGKPKGAIADYLNWIISPKRRRLSPILGLSQSRATEHVQTKPNDRPHVTYIIKIAGYSSILFLCPNLLLPASRRVSCLKETGLAKLFQTRWYPIEGYFGILPLLSGHCWSHFGFLIALPFGVGTAMFISEIAPLQIKRLLNR